MKHNTRFVLLAALAVTGPLHGGGAGVHNAWAAAAPAGRDRALDPANFTAVVTHPYFPLTPGTTSMYVERLGRASSDIELVVLREPKTIQGVICVVVRERVREKGTLTQESLIAYAQDADGNVWLFGEDAREFLERGRVSNEGSWEAGAYGAEAGIVMPAAAVTGAPYRQCHAAGVAEEMAQIVAVSDSVTVPFGTFTRCVKIKEWSMLESGTDRKWYAPGIGLVRAESASREAMSLISVSRP